MQLEVETKSVARNSNTAGLSGLNFNQSMPVSARHVSWSPFVPNLFFTDQTKAATFFGVKRHFMTKTIHEFLENPELECVNLISNPLYGWRLSREGKTPLPVGAGTKRKLEVILDSDSGSEE